MQLHRGEWQKGNTVHFLSEGLLALGIRTGICGILRTRSSFFRYLPFLPPIPATYIIAIIAHALSVLKVLRNVSASVFKMNSLVLHSCICCLILFFCLFKSQVKRNISDLTNIPVRHQQWDGWPASASDDSV